MLALHKFDKELVFSYCEEYIFIGKTWGCLPAIAM